MIRQLIVPRLSLFLWDKHVTLIPLMGFTHKQTHTQQERERERERAPKHVINTFSNSHYFPLVTIKFRSKEKTNLCVAGVGGKEALNVCQLVIGFLLLVYHIKHRLFV